MRSSLLRAAAIVVLPAILAALPVLAFAATVAPSGASDPGVVAQDHSTAGASHDVVPVARNMILGLIVVGVAGTVFYLFKRRVGGFPEHPSWVAPITIMRSKDFPDETTFGDLPVDDHGHGAHH
jgi:hypothetical protein